VLSYVHFVVFVVVSMNDVTTHSMNDVSTHSMNDVTTHSMNDVTTHSMNDMTTHSMNDVATHRLNHPYPLTSPLVSPDRFHENSGQDYGQIYV